MSASMEGLNPLRPYYIPPSVGSPSEYSQNVAAPSSISSKHAASPSTSFGASARNILADMDCSEYLSDSSPTPTEVVKKLLEQAVWKYMSIFLAQPFEVAKIILQVQVSTTGPQAISQAGITDDARRRPPSYRNDSYESPSDDSDPESPSYFTSAAPISHTPTRSSRSRRRRGSPDSSSRSRLCISQSPPSNHTKSPHVLELKSPHVLELKSPSSLLAVLSSLWVKEGSWGIWKGTNSTYVYSILFSTITSFARSFLSALLALPDPGLSFQLPSSFTYAGGLDVLSSPSPLTSLAVAVSAAGIAGIILTPLDTARTKLILTPSTHPPRSILSTLHSLPSWTLPFSLAPVTVLHSTLPTLLSASAPLFLRSKLGVDPLLTPNLFAIATFLGQSLELGAKLPIETVLRRGQAEIASNGLKSREMQTVVDIGPYKGLFGTMHSIIYEEGERDVRTGAGAKNPPDAAKHLQHGRTAQQRRKKKGQGLEGLWRGWRVGMWGLLGVWGAATLGGVGGKGGEF